MKITVSIVEDDPSVRTILDGWIRDSEDFHCLSDYSDAESAIKQLPVEKPSVVLMDVNLPGISGIECVRRLKPLLPDTQFVMLTVHEENNYIFDALAAGASGYLLKQTDFDKLLEALKEVHGGGSPMSSSIARKVVQFFRGLPPSTETAETLSPREYEVLDLLARGSLYKEIAKSLGISYRTVNTHIRRIYEKLQVCSRAQAVAKFALIPGRPANAPAPKQKM
jgi:DNA-binding NarL/FixJ family response regulator